jgi:predicted O-methyltransferase YrrM
MTRRVGRLLPPLRRLHDDRAAWVQAAQWREQELSELRPALENAQREAGEAKQQLEELLRNQPLYPPGHYYSPVPDLDAARRQTARIWPPALPELPGIDLNVPGQLALLKEFGRLYPDQPFSSDDQPGLRYRLDNEMYGYGDGLTLHFMLRLRQPARVLELGSGWSSAAMLDTDERFLDSRTEFTFVDPYPQRLNRLLRDSDAERVRVLETGAERLPIDEFSRLQSGDLLFIDSSHVSKVGSDVNHLVLDVLPQLSPGVIIHVHDVFYPFEYPREWVMEGRAWNEAYLLRAYLTNNPRTKVLWFGDYLRKFHQDDIAAAMPLATANPGCALWLEQT